MLLIIHALLRNLSDVNVNITFTMSIGSSVKMLLSSVFWCLVCLVV